MSAPVADPSQVFADPSQMEAMQGGQPPEDQGGQPEQGPPQEGPPQPYGQQQPPIDLEGSIAHAIEVGCEQAIAATTVNPEDYMRFCQGVSFLAAAMKDLQPQPMDPAQASLTSTAIQADQRHRAAMAQVAAQRDAAAAQQQAAASRPTSSQPSPRG